VNGDPPQLPRRGASRQTALAQKRDRPAGKPPTEARLHEAALAHLGKFASTEVSLARVLVRRVDRWARRAEAEGQDHDQVAAAAGAARLAAHQVARRLASSGAVDDAAFAASRAARLARGGRSRRAIAAHLSAKGVTGEVAQAVLPNDEVGAALMLCRRRRFGPFAREAVTPEVRLKALAALARAGFAHGVATAALGMEPEQAEDRIRAMRDG
jgi:regulatory protein